MTVLFGISAGFTVGTSDESGISGGFIGECISGRARNTKISNLKSVTASETSGKAGGFVGYAKAGDALANAGDSVTSSGLPAGIEIENLLGVVSALRPNLIIHLLIMFQQEKIHRYPQIWQEDLLETDRQ